ncbi:MAG: hypothetical protein HG439_002810 [candidate division SR1 bacterium]|nr:hypothetical protein [candidate division SR1 bacterium]
MFSKLRQTVFLAGFGLVCCIFIFFVPFSSKPQVVEEEVFVSSGGENVVEEVKNQIFTGVLHIGVDPSFSKEDFGILKDEFMQKYGSDAVFQYLGVEQRGFSGYDLLLTAYDKAGALSGGELRFSQALDQYFLSGSSEVLASGRFIPYAIDPIVVFYQSGSANSLSELYQDYKSQTGSAFLFPLYVGTGFFDQNVAYTQVISDFSRYNDNGAFEMWLEMYQDSELGVSTLLQSLPKTEICQSSPVLCLIDKGVLKVGFGFFSEWRQFPQLQQIAYPYWYEAAPVRMYGFILNPESQYRPLAESFLTMYLQMESSKLKSLFDAQGRYSAFGDVFNQQCQEKQTCQSLYPIRVLERSQEKVQKLLKDVLFSKVLEKKMKPDLYLQRVSL